MVYRVEVQEKPGVFDAVGQGVKKDIFDLGTFAVSGVRFVQVYLIEGDISEKDACKISSELLIDPVTQDYRIIDQSVSENKKRSQDLVVEIAYNPGVMDPVEESTLKGIADLGISGVTAVKTAKKYLFTGKISHAQLKIITDKLLCNKLIQHAAVSDCHCEPKGRSNLKKEIASSQNSLLAMTGTYDFKLITVDLLGASDEGLLEISKKGQLFLNIHEMRQIRNYFKDLKRNPTDCELETIAQTWSEHCYHKTFRGKIKYREDAG
ncbi:MAG: phosphoribosylformylglycinamidine synthase subunit PurS, partial [Candidatus Omnitrophica bacterium]|nr:phosphoribosylformylglycinamidine synthase subunit PurS [Candidatus Omnitrophota bacterium]